MRVLIVEDEDRLRHMMRLTLEAAGYEIGDAASGEAGLEQFGDGGGWDAVLLDQRLPGIDGLETLRRLKQRDPGCCVVMVTAFGSIELAVDAMKLGATDFLRKPLSPESLRGALAAALTGASARRAGRSPGLVAGQKPGIVHLTMNGFQISQKEGRHEGAAPLPQDHRFTVTHFASGESREIVVSIDPDEIARVARLTRRDLKAEGGFWRDQAERYLADYLWVEGRIPDDGRLRLTGVSRDLIELAAAWQGD